MKSPIAFDRRAFAGLFVRRHNYSFDRVGALRAARVA
jgi:hypothetical protein